MTIRTDSLLFYVIMVMLFGTALGVVSDVAPHFEYTRLALAGCTGGWAIGVVAKLFLG